MPMCKQCGAEFGPEERVCPACGQAAMQRSHDTLMGLDDAGIVCPNCDTYNDANRTTCASCGHPIGHAAGYPGAQNSPFQPAPPAERPGQTHKELAAKRPPEQPATPAPATEAIAFLPPPQIVDTSTQTPPPKAAFPFRLRLLRGHGNVNSAFDVKEQGTSLGRSNAIINMVDDPCLSPLHARLRPWGEHLVIEDLGSINGTFLRLRGPTRVGPETEFIAGSQRLVLLGLGGPVRDSRASHSNDTQHYGGPPDKKLLAAFRIVHRGPDDRPWLGNVFLRAGERITVGRHDCDLNFPHDRHMAEHHLTMVPGPRGLGLLESKSSSGVYLRIQAASVLQIGDEILVGQEIFRIELV